MNIDPSSFHIWNRKGKDLPKHNVLVSNVVSFRVIGPNLALLRETTMRIHLLLAGVER
jgi:hypothetical protein